MDEFIDYVMNTIASKGFDREKLKNRLESDWIALDIKGSQLIKEINDILKDAGATDAQIKWGDDLPVLSLEKEKRINKLETDLKNEIKQKTEKQLSAVNWNVDVVLTHTCPQKYVPIEAFLPGLDQSMVDHSTEEWLDRIEDRLNYKDWFCGHWHIDKRVDKMHFMMRSVEAL